MFNPEAYGINLISEAEPSCWCTCGCSGGAGCDSGMGAGMEEPYTEGKCS
jgi:hypothetical protein